MNIRELAEHLHTLGLNVMPVVIEYNKKRPLIPIQEDSYSWVHLKECRLSLHHLLQSIDILIEQKQTVYLGIIPGLIKDGKYKGYYFFAVDFDNTRWVEILKVDEYYKKNHTWLERSLSKGHHLYGITEDNVKYDKQQELGIELFSDDTFFIAIYNNFEHELYELKPTVIKKLYDTWVERLAQLQGITIKKEKKPIQDIKKGVSYGDRNNSAFKVTCDYRDKGLTIEETTKLMLDWNKKNFPPMHDGELITCIKSAYKRNKPGEIYSDADKATLQEVYGIIDKWLHMTDKRRVDLILATALSNKEPGTTIWLIILGASGDAKSETVRALEGYENVIKIDQITPNTLASGKPDMRDKEGNIIARSDLGYQLQNKNTILVIPDLASLSSKKAEDKAEIWGQFRNLYDGFINKRTGAGVERLYENCHVSMIGCSTPVLRDEIIVHSQLGTRELLWDTGKEDNIGEPETKDKIMMAWDNEKTEELMRSEIKDTIQNFLKHTKFKRIDEKDIPEDMKKFLCEEARRIAVLRATGMIDQTYRELNNPVVPEIPTRTIKQFKRLYISLKSLDSDYTDDRVKSIIKTIVDSSGNMVRQLVLEVLSGCYDRWYQIKEIQSRTRLGRNSVKSQLEMLWNMDVIEKDVRPEQIGGYVYHNENTGIEEHRGGHIEDVSYYRYKVSGGTTA